MTRVLEVCVDNYESALTALAAGASRLELCSSLDCGGLTPTLGLLKQIKLSNAQNVPVFCMLRCRPGNFLYSDEEIKIMVSDAKILKLNGADGFVFGALTETGSVDLKKCREILKTCYPLPITFHRAFDLVKNPLIEIEVVIDLGFERLLTSGQKKTALEGCALLKQLIKRSNNRIVIIPGSGVNRSNIREIMEETGAREYHGSFKAIPRSSDDIANGKNDIMDLGSIIFTDHEHVADVIQILKS